MCLLLNYIRHWRMLITADHHRLLPTIDHRHRSPLVAADYCWSLLITADHSSPPADHRRSVLIATDRHWLPPIAANHRSLLIASYHRWLPPIAGDQCWIADRYRPPIPPIACDCRWSPVITADCLRFYIPDSINKSPVNIREKVYSQLSWISKLGAYVKC